MLYAFGFERIGVVAGDLFFIDPDPSPGQEGAERGVRLELRLLERGPLRGSIYSAQPVMVDRPIWRVDLLESVDSPGTLNRAHHHPSFRGWEPGPRNFVDELSTDPLTWVAGRLSDLRGVLHQAGVEASAAGPSDGPNLARAVPEVIDAVRRLLDGVRAGELGRPPVDGELSNARIGWL